MTRRFDLESTLETQVIETLAMGVARSAALGVVRLGPSGAFRLTRFAGATPDDHFDLASVTKPFVALTAALLSERGLFDSDAKLAKFLPAIEGTRGGSASATEHLCHRAGLAPHLLLDDGASFGEPLAREKSLKRAANARRATPPEEATYSDLGYILTGHALERAREMPLDTLVRSTLFEGERIRVGSSRQLRDDVPGARFIPTEWLPTRGGLLEGAVHDDNAWFLAGYGLSGHAGMFGTLDGVLDFAERVLRGALGEPGLSGVLDKMLAPRAHGTLRVGFDGVSAKSSAGTLASPNTFGHLGFTGTSLWIDPTRRAAIVFLTNRVCFGRDPSRIKAARPRVHDALWQALDAPPLNADERWGAGQAPRTEGCEKLTPPAPPLDGRNGPG